MLINILLFASLIICFLLPIIIVIVFFRQKGRHVLLPFVLGALVYIVGEKIAWKYCIDFLAYVTVSDVNVWSNKWIYGAIMGITAGIITEAIRIFVLIWRNNKKKWTNSFRRNIVFGIGEGWAAAIFIQGIYYIQLVFKLVQNGNLDNEGLEAYSMMLQLVERVSATLLFVGLTFLVQYGIKRRRGKKYNTMAIVIHCVADMLLYYIPYALGLSTTVGAAVYMIISAGTLFYGYKKMESVNHTHHSRHSKSKK